MTEDQKQQIAPGEKWLAHIKYKPTWDSDYILKKMARFGLDNDAADAIIVALLDRAARLESKVAEVRAYNRNKGNTA